MPAVAIAPATSSRYFEAAAIMARAESLTVEGACPSAQLIEPSAVAFWPRCGTISRSSLSDLKNKRPLSGPRVMLGAEAVFSQTGLMRCARTGGRFL